VRGRKGEYKKLFFDLQRQGFSRVRVNGVVRELGEEIDLDKKRKHTIDVVVDRSSSRTGSARAWPTRWRPRSASPTGSSRSRFRTARGWSFPSAWPVRTVASPFPRCRAHVLVQQPVRACPECGGIGTRFEIDPERLVPNANRSLAAGALAPWAGRENVYFKQTLGALAKRYKFSLDEPWARLRKPVRDVVLHGDRDGGSRAW